MKEISGKVFGLIVLAVVVGALAVKVVMQLVGSSIDGAVAKLPKLM